jgi:hypothetical protein
MSLKHINQRIKKTASIEIGDFVTLMIPCEDRGHSDLNRITGQVFAKNGGDGKHETYSIVTAYRKLSEKYPVKCLSIYEGNSSFKRSDRRIQRVFFTAFLIFFIDPKKKIKFFFLTDLIKKSSVIYEIFFTAFLFLKKKICLFIF